LWARADMLTFFIHIFSHALSSDTFPNFLGSHPT
jgi:hypothetical protein